MPSILSTDEVASPPASSGPYLLMPPSVITTTVSRPRSRDEQIEFLSQHFRTTLDGRVFFARRVDAEAVDVPEPFLQDWGPDVVAPGVNAECRRQQRECSINWSGRADGLALLEGVDAAHDGRDLHDLTNDELKDLADLVWRFDQDVDGHMLMLSANAPDRA